VQLEVPLTICLLQTIDGVVKRTDSARRAMVKALWLTNIDGFVEITIGEGSSDINRVHMQVMLSRDETEGCLAEGRGKGLSIRLGSSVLGWDLQY